MVALLHKHGGLITRVTHIGHQTTNGVADWFFRGDIDWQCGGKVSKDREIYPWMLCYETPEQKAELERLTAALNEYLRETGTWLTKPKHKRDGRIVHWEPHKPNGKSPLARAIR